MAQHEHITTLFHKYLNGEHSREELDELLRYFELEEESDQLVLLITREFEEPVPAAIQAAEVDAINKSVRKRLVRKIKPPVRLWTTITAAAVIIGLLCMIGVFYFSGIDGTSDGTAGVLANDALPGGNRATLTLADGRSIILSEDKEGIITTDVLAYDDGAVIAAVPVSEYATLSTPNGGQYRLTLSDGTKVWLNAASSISYPIRFTGDERKVEISGEAYFEVTQNEAQPFVVQSKEQTLTVLGTAFNINAYDNEPAILTTLVSGSIALSNAVSGEIATLRPEQLAHWDGSRYAISDVDVSQYTAWKNGEFKFRATPLPEVIRQLERWYGISVEDTDIPATKIHASIKRDKKLSSVLYAIEEVSGIKFNISERGLQIQE